MTEVRAEITANVWQVRTEVGAAVALDDELVILESMKMEIPVTAPSAGTVTEVPGRARRQGAGGRRGRRPRPVIHVSAEGSVTVVTLDRPERRNAVDLDTLLELRAVIDDAPPSEQARVLVLTGAERHVLRRRRPHRRRGRRVRRGAHGRADRADRAARLHGGRGAGGRPRGRHAARHRLRPAGRVDRRVLRHPGQPARADGRRSGRCTACALLVGGSAARAMLLAAEPLSAEQAHELGLRPPDRRRPTTPWLGRAHRRAGADERRRAQAGPGADVPARAADADVQAAFRAVWASADAREGPAAFLAKRPPRSRAAEALRKLTRAMRGGSRPSVEAGVRGSAAAGG